MGYYHSCEKQIDNGSVLPRRKDCKYQKVLHQKCGTLLENSTQV